jgi:hypothetical protein
LPYAVFGSVIWAAHHQFGKHSLLDRPPVVVADRAPLKLKPSLRPPDRSAPASEVDRVEHRLLSAGRQNPVASSSQAERPGLAGLQFGMRARVESLDARLAKGSIAGPEEMPTDAPAETTPAPLAEARESAPASGTPPKPSFKPIELIQAVAAAAAPDREPAVGARVEIARAPPPRPALKPIVMPASEFDRRPDAQNAVGAADDSLPEALRAWWASVKILLASGPAQPAGHAGGDDSDRQAAQRSINAHADAGGAGSEEARGGGANDRGGGSGGANDRGTGGGGSADSGAADGGGSGAGGGDDGGTNGGGSSGAGGDRGNSTGGGGSSADDGSGRSGGIAGDVGRGIGDSIGSIADGVGRGIGDSVGRGSSTSRGDGDRGGRGGGRGARGDDRGGRDADRGGDNDRGDRGGRDGGGRGGGNDRGDRGDD